MKNGLIFSTGLIALALAATACGAADDMMGEADALNGDAAASDAQLADTAAGLDATSDPDAHEAGVNNARKVIHPTFQN